MQFITSYTVQSLKTSATVAVANDHETLARNINRNLQQWAIWGHRGTLEIESTEFLHRAIDVVSEYIENRFGPASDDFTCAGLVLSSIDTIYHSIR